MEFYLTSSEGISFLWEGEEVLLNRRGSEILLSGGTLVFSTDSKNEVIDALVIAKGKDPLGGEEQANGGEESNEGQQQNGGEGLLEYAWNSPLARWLVPDKLSVSIGGDLAFGLGVGAQPVNFTILTRGKDPGLYLTPTFNATAGITAKAEGSINLVRAIIQEIHEILPHLCFLVLRAQEH